MDSAGSADYYSLAADSDVCAGIQGGCCQQKGAYSRLLLYMAYEVLPVMRSSVVRGCMRNRHLLVREGTLP